MTEQNIMTVSNDIKLQSYYKENGQWRITETSACSGHINYGQLVFLKVFQV